ncbi:phenylacetaldehyde synthase-like [Magnolia sinica]|uniref:phenylacetaldehyde synthase-like n=1 Tax=Magnolia sinica TaxID=86752 RepID=UPI00265ACD98|nr:phenylacetaldehyde synthase-like [Magnolia sinica]
MGSLRSNISNPLDPDDFARQSHIAVDFIANYYRTIESYPVRSQVEPGYLKKQLPESTPFSPEPLETILQDIHNHIIPGLTHWQSPNFFAYFQANASTAGFLGEMLCTGFNVVGFNWITSPAATELEGVVMDWMAKILDLPQSFMFSGLKGGGGVLHGSTCEAIVCTLAAARDKVLDTIGWDQIGKLVVYGSDQTHFTLQKASKLVGIRPSNFRILPTSATTSFALSPDIARKAMENDVASGLVPLFLCATVGTTASGATDPLDGLGRLAREFGVWFHVDAAYAGAACICPEFRSYLDGVDFADSLSMNPHKWFLTNMDCCCLWVKNPNFLTNSLATDPEILKNNATDGKRVVDYKDWQIALSRRFRAMKLWVVLRMHGVVNLRNHIRSDVALAERFEGLVATDSRFEVLVPRKFALVCFRLKPIAEEDGSRVNRELLEGVNVSGRAYMTHAVVGGTYVLRFAVGATMTEERHVDDTWKLIQEKADSLVNEYITII